MVIFVLRHADRNSAADTLSPAGVKRANLLARMLADSGVSAGYHSNALRTQQTLKPLKQALGDAIVIGQMPPNGPGGGDAHVQAVVAAIEALPAAAVAVVVSHSDTVGRIITGLGGDEIEPIAEGEFDNLFLLFRPADGPRNLVRLRY